jgi:hypothetical protein
MAPIQTNLKPLNLFLCSSIQQKLYCSIGDM